METIKPQPINTIPYFYQNPSGYAAIKRVDNGGMIGDTVIPVVKFVKYEVRIPSMGYTFDIPHDIGQIHEVFGRYKVKGSEQWRMIYNFDAIEPLKVTITFTETPDTKPYQYQLFFTSYQA